MIRFGTNTLNVMLRKYAKRGKHVEELTIELACVKQRLDPFTDFIEERGIDAGALYYTELEEFAEAEAQMSNTMVYMPRASKTEE